jgi:hypothetical protein
MRRAILESPYQSKNEAKVQLHLDYARAAMLHSLAQGESALASHLIWPWILDDADPAEREQGMIAGFAWHRVAEASVIYTDLGISNGMEAGIAMAKLFGLPVEYRKIPNWQA